MFEVIAGWFIALMVAFALVQVARIVYSEIKTPSSPVIPRGKSMYEKYGKK